ncbi:MAG: hypothetical protein IT453_03700, partial [Planctomycetes bacterium]|nr:hypothetical protein [Planctomycetota bacterium]
AADETEPSLDRLSFAKPSGEIAATIDFARLEFGRTQPGSIELAPAAEGDAAAPDRIVVRAHAHATVSQRGVSFDFTLAAEPGTLGVGWRR